MTSSSTEDVAPPSNADMIRMLEGCCTKLTMVYGSLDSLAVTLSLLSARSGHANAEYRNSIAQIGTATDSYAERLKDVRNALTSFVTYYTRNEDEADSMRRMVITAAVKLGTQHGWDVAQSAFPPSVIELAKASAKIIAQADEDCAADESQESVDEIESKGKEAAGDEK